MDEGDALGQGVDNRHDQTGAAALALDVLLDDLAPGQVNGPQDLS